MDIGLGLAVGSCNDPVRRRDVQSEPPVMHDAAKAMDPVGTEPPVRLDAAKAMDPLRILPALTEPPVLPLAAKIDGAAHPRTSLGTWEGNIAWLACVAISVDAVLPSVPGDPVDPGCTTRRSAELERVVNREAPEILLSGKPVSAAAIARPLPLGDDLSEPASCRVEESLRDTFSMLLSVTPGATAGTARLLPPGVKLSAHVNCALEESCR